MPTLRDIRKRLKAIKGTKKITSAMKMVAAAKLRKVQDRMLNFRPYAIKMDAVLSDLARAVEGSGGLHPLLTRRTRKKVEVVVMTSDKGLCGAFNSNLLRAASQQIAALKKEGLEVGVSVIGRKARDYFRRRDISPRKIWIGLSGKLNYANVQEIANDLTENYTNETFDEIALLYNEFKSIIQQKVSVVRLLPIGGLEPEEGASAAEAGPFAPFLYEPSRELLFDRLLPKHIEIQIYRALLESQSAEEAARMAAMENASKNCEDLIVKVTLQANKVRQAGITKELMDIVGGVEALKQ
ncbi:MAG: ATP synthase F1 subunit gamma [Thermodesulfovibrio sp.]|nr:ATP synthase F1 subunit gamma [Thermodesulfovibrio sp.]